MIKLPEYFGDAYLINLPERLDRLRTAKKELARVKWEIGPSEIQLFPGRKYSERGGFPTAGVRGAFYSHWDCLQRAQANHHRGVLILEDDICFSSSLAQLTPSILSQLEAERWDFVFFGHNKTGSIPDAHSKTTTGTLKFSLWTKEIQGLHFYGVSERILARLNAHLELVAGGVEGDQDTGPMPIDGALNNFRRMNPDVRTLIANPKLGWQRPSRSDITPKKFDSVRVLRPLTTALRNIKYMTNSWRS